MNEQIKFKQCMVRLHLNGDIIIRFCNYFQQFSYKNTVNTHFDENTNSKKWKTSKCIEWYVVWCNIPTLGKLSQQFSCWSSSHNDGFPKCAARVMMASTCRMYMSVFDMVLRNLVIILWHRFSSFVDRNSVYYQRPLILWRCMFGFDWCWTDLARDRALS